MLLDILEMIFSFLDKSVKFKLNNMFFNNKQYD